MVIVEICYATLTCSDALLALKAALAQRRPTTGSGGNSVEWCRGVPRLAEDDVGKVVMPKVVVLCGYRCRAFAQSA